MNFSRLFVISLGLALGFSAQAEPVAELGAFSAFKTVNLEKLAGGAVQSARGAAMSHPRGLAVESVYVIRKPLGRAVQLHQQWSPLRHPELKVWVHGELSPRSGAGDFAKLKSAPSNGAVKALVGATLKLGSGGTELQLSKAEMGAFAGTPGGEAGAMPEKVANFWGQVLAGRLQAYTSGGLGKLAPYENGAEAIRPADEVARLLKDAPKVRGQFAGLIEGSRGGLTPTLYWELVNVEDSAAVNLGAAYAKPGTNSWQGLDVQFYASGGYCALVSLVQMWPVTIGGEEMTLAWRGDLISSAELASLKGVERMGSSTAMMRETQKFIERFLADAAKAP